MCAGVDTEVYTQEWFDTDYQVMLWDVAFEMLLGAGRDLLAMPPLTKEERDAVDAIDCGERVSFDPKLIA